jgi:AcrR family transcriptional regulator
MAATPTRSRLPKADRMAQALSAAHTLFAERGFAAVTMDEVAAEVGVTKPLLYNYFGNKEQLYIACMKRSGDALVTMILETVGDASSPSEALNDGLRAFFAFLDADRAAWAVLFDETLPHSGELADRVAEYRGRLIALVSESLLAQLPAKRRGAARIEVEALSTALLGSAEALARWWLRTEATSAGEAAELLIATLEPGLRLRSTPSAKSSRPKPKGESS